MRISRGERHGFGAAESLPTRASSLNKGEPEVRWSHHRSWSDISGLDQPGSQNSYPHALLELQQRRPPCARESWYIMVRLPPWQDVAAEHFAPGRLNAVLSLSSHPQARPFYRDGSLLLSAVFRIFLQKVDIHPPGGLVRLEFFLLGTEPLPSGISLLPFHGMLG